MASQVYYNGDWYECVTATSAGESPASHPAKWAKLEIPYAFGRFLQRRAASLLLAEEGQQDKQAIEERASALILDDTILRSARINGRGNPIQVFTR